MEAVLSLLRTRFSAGTSVTRASGLTTPSGGLTALVIEAGGPTAHPTRDSVTPSSVLTTHIAAVSGQTVPLGGLTTRIAEANSPTASSGSPTTPMTAPTTSHTPHAATMTPSLPSTPHAAPTTPASISVPCVAPMTPLATSLVAQVLPPAAQPVPHVLQANAVLVSPVVHSHPMWT
jgi:hypothetical protein